LPLIEQGRAALRDGDAATARRAFEAALAESESGAVLDGLAEALYLGREYAAAATHYERAYAAYRREGERMAAGRAARMVAWITGNVFGDWAVQSGWFARAVRILEEAGEDGDLTLVICGWPYAELEANRNDIEGNYLKMLDLAPPFADRVDAATRETRYVGTAVPNYFRKPYGPGWGSRGSTPA
jgi:hypothetical protein